MPGEFLGTSRPSHSGFKNQAAWRLVGGWEEFADERSEGRAVVVAWVCRQWSKARRTKLRRRRHLSRDFSKKRRLRLVRST